MNVLRVFSNNLKALMATREDLSSNYKVSTASGVGPTSVRRFMLEEAAAQIDSVEKVAGVFKLRTCDILDPDLIRRLEAKEPLRMGEHRLPVMPEADWKALSPRTRALLEDLCQRSLAGTLDDDDIKWLHDSLERTKPKAPEPKPLPLPDVAGGVPPKNLTVESKHIHPGIPQGGATHKL